jgi:hypothetical protein
MSVTGKLESVNLIGAYSLFVTGARGILALYSICVLSVNNKPIEFI